MDFTLRAAKEDDLEFVFKLNKVNMKKYVDQIRGWDEAYEREDMKNRFEPGVDQIIQVGGKDAGVWKVSETSEYFFIKHIELLPEFQSLGIGTKLINRVIVEAQEKKKPVLIQVLNLNPAIKLYERLGFKRTGENGLKIQLRFN